jgi:hypothetical protein
MSDQQETIPPTLPVSDRIKVMFRKYRLTVI